MPRIALTRHIYKTVLAALIVSAAGAREGASQETKAQLGLRSAGALGFFLGGGQAIHDLPGGEFGALVDLGWAWAPRLRLVGDVSWFIGHLEEYVPQDDEDFSGPVFDLSSTVSLMALSGSSNARQTVYASLGFSIHALSSSFHSVPLDQRYNANRFGITGAVGGRIWLGQQGQQALFIEARETGVSEMTRWTVRSGFLYNFGPLRRPSS